MTGVKILHVQVLYQSYETRRVSHGLKILLTTDYDTFP